MTPDTGEQLDLIPDLEPAQARKIKGLIRKRNQANDEHLEAKRKADEFDVQIMEAVREAGGKPDVNGVIRMKCGEAVIEIKPGKAKLKIEERDASVDEDDEPGEGELLEGAEQESRRGRVGNRG